MGSQPVWTYISLCLLLIQEGRGYNAELNHYIQGLEYNPSDILVYKGERISSVIKRNGHFDSKNSFIEIKRELKTIENAQVDIGVVAANEHKVFPGALLVANTRLLDNIPDQLSVERTPIKYTVNLPGLTNGEGSFNTVPSFANYQSALNNVLEQYFNENPNGRVNSNFQYETTMVYSASQLRVAFGVSISHLIGKLNLDFENINNSEKLVKIIRFRQIFYTVSVENPTSPGDVFGPRVNLESFKSKVSRNTPPVLVDSVSYGRVIYVKIETSSTDQSAKAILNGKFNKFNIERKNEVDYSNQLKDFSMQVFIIGGSNDQVDIINTRSMKDINDIIIKYNRVGPHNPAYPISYSCQFLKDNTGALVQSSTDYVDTTRTEHQRGVIKLVHYAGFVASFIVEWDEVTYDNRGGEIIRRVKWNKGDKSTTLGYREEIELNANCRNIRVFAEFATGWIGEWWRTLFDKRGIPLIHERTFEVLGTIFNAHYSIEPPL